MLTNVLPVAGTSGRGASHDGSGKRSVPADPSRRIRASPSNEVTWPLGSSGTDANGQEVMGPTGYVAYWQYGKLTRITDGAKTPNAIECQGDRDQQRATEMRIQNETMRAISSGRDRGAAVLFLKAGGGELGCAGARACSYMGGEPNSGKPLSRIGASE